MDQNTLQKNIEAARARGVSEDLIQQRVKQIQSSQPKQSLTSKIGEGAINLGKSIISPFETTARNIVGTPVALLAGATEKKYAEKGQVGPLEKLAKEILPKGASEDTRKNVVNQLKASANIASYAVPFGKGANIATKALLPGAAVGGLQAISEENATPGSVVGGALLGSAGAGLLEGITKLPSAIKKIGKGTEKVGTATRAGVSKVTVAPSVYGASKEKAIQKTMDDLGIVGNAQQKYEKLQPTMERLGGQIETKLAESPKTFQKKDLTDSFFINLKDKIRTREITQGKAKKAVTDYVSDLIGNKNISTIDSKTLFGLKKTINNDYANVANKIARGTPLNPTDQVISVARQTLDDIISKAHPDVKILTTQQSHLYDAAKSLARTRKTVPTVRVAGTTIPASALQTGQDVLGVGVQRAGRKIEKVGGMLPDLSQLLTTPTAKTISGQIASRLPNIPQAIQPTDQAQTEMPQADQTQQVNQQIQHKDILSPGGQWKWDYEQNDWVPVEKTQDQTGELTADKLYQAMQLDLQTTGGKNLDKLKTMYDLAQKRAGTGKGMTATQVKEISDFDVSSKLLTQLPSDIDKYKDIMGPVKGTIAAANPYNTDAQAFNSKMTAVAQNVGRAMEGGVLRQEDVAKYRKMLPNIQDTPEVAKRKIENVSGMIKLQMETKKSLYTSTPTTSTTELPSIDQLTVDYGLYR